MLQGGRTAALAKLRRSADDYRGWPVWAVFAIGNGTNARHHACSGYLQHQAIWARSRHTAAQQLA